MKIRGIASWILVASVAGLGTAACGSSTPPKSSASAPSSAPAATSPAASPSAAASFSGVEATIAANWTAFFDPKTSAAQKTNLLQNGSDFAAVFASESSNAQASQSSAKVDSVTDVTASSATVTYDILLSGTPVLTGQKGTAVYQNGVWKVGDVSFCGLLTLEGAKSLPADCKAS